jgi:LPXTG-motif cell wall-anchored protein
MPGRAIVRITEPDGSHVLVLAVPSRKLLSSARNRLVLYPSQNRETLRAWAAPGSRTAFEFVYPKLEAVAITGDGGTSALAVDPVWDRLPENLTADDMKVVTLWLLSPKRITADHHGEGVAAAHYKPSTVDEGTDEGKSSNVLMAKTSPPKNVSGGTLPKTATNTYSLGIAGIIVLISGLLAHGLRTRTVRG